MLISPAYAQAGGGADMFASFIPLILIFAVFYFLLVRPQQKKMKQHREMLASIQRGDRIVTGGGIIGTVARVVNDDEILVDVADGVRVQALRSMVANVLTRGISESADADDGAEEETESKPRASRRSRRRKPKAEEAAAPGEPANDAGDAAEPASDATAETDAGADEKPKDSGN
jgi:preprotein translocase subunit YajC